MSASAFGTYYIWYPINGQQIVSNVMWHSVNIYYRVVIYFEKMDQFQPSIIAICEEDNDDELLSYYNSETRTIISLGTDTENIPAIFLDDIKNTEGLLIFQKTSSNLYKTFNHYEDFINTNSEWHVIEKQFVQVELEQDGKIIDIHKHLDSFYIEGNHILSKSFLQWYLQSMYKINLSNTYTLKIFDKDINLFSLHSESCILLGDDGYSVIPSTTILTDYEGALNN